MEFTRSVYNLLIVLLIPKITGALNNCNGTLGENEDSVEFSQLQRAVFGIFCLGILFIGLCYMYLCDWCPKRSDMDDEYRSIFQFVIQSYQNHYTYFSFPGNILAYNNYYQA